MTEFTFPLGIDLHVHFRTPGSGKKETLATGYDAAFSNGIGTVCDMPNTNPTIDTVKNLNEKLKSLELYPYIHQFGAMTNANINSQELKEMASINRLFKVYLADSTGGIGISQDNFTKGLNLIEDDRPLIFIHAEDPNLILPRSEKLQELTVRPPLAEDKAIEWIVDVAKDYSRVLFHVTHVSTAKSAELLLKHKFSWDVLAKHLAFNNENISKFGNYGIMNPPLRSENDRLALYDLFKEGKIPMLTSDHSPHTHSDKKSIVAGAPGVQELYRYILDEFVSGSITKQNATSMIFKNPKKLLDLYQLPTRLGEFIFDDSMSYELSSDKIMSKCGWSLWENHQFKGDILHIVTTE